MIDVEDFYLDLLFYHRKLRRLVAVELKLDRFKAADKGQMELYLRWLEKHEMERGEGTPIGLILCADKGDERVELLQLDRSGIRVAAYLTDLPPRQLLRRKLHETLVAARRGCKGVRRTGARATEPDRQRGVSSFSINVTSDRPGKGGALAGDNPLSQRTNRPACRCMQSLAVCFPDSGK